MKTRKHPTPVKKRAHRQAAKRAVAQRRPGSAREKAARAASPEGSSHRDGSLTLVAECTAAAAESLKSDLARRLDEPQPVVLDVSALQRIDTAGLQLLAAFVRDRRVAGRAVQWQGRAAALDIAAGLLGLTAMLELPGEDGR